MDRHEIKYQLGDDVPFKENIAYAAQHIIFFVASAVVLPVVVGYALGLSQSEVAFTLQRTFFLCGVVSMVQTAFGHRYPIIDGPAGLWAGLLILMTGNMAAFGKSAADLRSNIELGMIIAGAVIVLLVVFKLINIIAKLFTPIINGVLILLMVLQISPSIVKGMTGISESNGVIDWKSTVLFFFTMFLILLLNMYGTPFIKSIASFVGVLVGWVLAYIMGLAESTNILGNGIISLPKVFAWGTPSFDLGVTITCIIAALVLLSMTFASLDGMSDVVGDTVDDKRFSHAIGIHGLTTMICGIIPTVGYMPFVSSTGIVKMTGVAARKPFYLASIGMIIMGLVAPFGTFFSTIPSPVGYGALIMIYALIMGQAFSQFRKVEFTNRECFIVGISVLIGMGFMFLPATAFKQLPQVAGYIMSNGLIVGMVIAFLLEHVVLRKK